MSAVLPFGKLRFKDLLDLFIGIAAGFDQAVSAVFLRYIDIPQFIANLPVAILNQKRRLKHDIIRRTAPALLFHLF